MTDIIMNLVTNITKSRLSQPRPPWLPALSLYIYSWHISWGFDFLRFLPAHDWYDMLWQSNMAGKSSRWSFNANIIEVNEGISSACCNYLYGYSLVLLYVQSLSLSIAIPKVQLRLRASWWPSQTEPHFEACCTLSHWWLVFCEWFLTFNSSSWGRFEGPHHL